MTEMGIIPKYFFSVGIKLLVASDVSTSYVLGGACAGRCCVFTKTLGSPSGLGSFTTGGEKCQVGGRNGDSLNNEGPLRHTCEKYKTWKTIGDSPIKPKAYRLYNKYSPSLICKRHESWESTREV